MPKTFAECPRKFFEFILPVFALKENVNITSQEESRSHSTEVPATGHVISEWSRKVTFYFTKILNDRKLREEIVRQIVRFVFLFSLERHIENLKCFHTVGSCEAYLAPTIFSDKWRKCL